MDDPLMTDANVRIPAEVRDRLARVAAAEGMSLRAYLSRLAATVSTPTARKAHAQQAKEALFGLNGYDLTPAEEQDLDVEIDRRLGQTCPGTPRSEESYDS